MQTWYQEIERPSWTPPDLAFPIVWTLLYLTMAVAAWLVWRWGGGAQLRRAFLLFALQLGLNFAWSFLFFGLRSPLLGLIDIVALWLAILATMAAFAPISRLAFWLMVPYWLWVTYAASLNLGILILNA